MEVTLLLVFANIIDLLDGNKNRSDWCSYPLDHSYSLKQCLSAPNLRPASYSWAHRLYHQRCAITKIQTCPHQLQPQMRLRLLRLMLIRCGTSKCCRSTGFEYKTGTDYAHCALCAETQQHLHCVPQQRPT